MDPLLDARLRREAGKESANVGRFQRSSPERAENRVSTVKPERGTPIQPASQNCEGHRIKPDDSTLVTLPVKDRQERQIRTHERREAPHPATVRTRRFARRRPTFSFNYTATT